MRRRGYPHRLKINRGGQGARNRPVRVLPSWTINRGTGLAAAVLHDGHPAAADGVGPRPRECHARVCGRGTHARTHARTDARTHRRTHTHASTHTHTHARTHAQTHARTRALRRTHTHAARERARERTHAQRKTADVQVEQLRGAHAPFTRSAHKSHAPGWLPMRFTFLAEGARAIRRERLPAAAAPRPRAHEAAAAARADERDDRHEPLHAVRPRDHGLGHGAMCSGAAVTPRPPLATTHRVLLLG